MPGKKASSSKDNTRVTPTNYERRPAGDDNGDVSLSPTPANTTSSEGRKSASSSKKKPS